MLLLYLLTKITNDLLVDDTVKYCRFSVIYRWFFYLLDLVGFPQVLRTWGEEGGRVLQNLMEGGLESICGGNMGGLKRHS